MKRIFATFVLGLFATAAGAAFGQQPGLEVVKFEWKPNLPPAAAERTVKPSDLPQFPHQDYTGGNLRTPPTPDYQKTADDTFSRDTYARKNDKPNPADQAELAPNRGRTINAALELKNGSGREIAAFEADYVFFDRDKKEYLRYRLKSNKTIKAGETVRVKKEVGTKNLGDFTGGATPATIFAVAPVETKIEIVSIKYADGSVWTAP